MNKYIIGDNNSIIVYVGSSVTVHNPFFHFVLKVCRNKLMRSFVGL